MEKLDEYIKKWNLIFTNTLKEEDFCRVDFDLTQTKVNYCDSISMFHFLSSFNKLYLKFKKDYEKIDKLNFEKYLEVLSFDQFVFDQDYYRNLIFHLKKSNITDQKDTLLYIREVNGIIKPFVTNHMNPYDQNYYCKNVKLNLEIAKKYLDLFEQYHLLLDMYNYLKNNQIFGKSAYFIFTFIDNRESNLLEKLNQINLNFGCNYFNSENYVELSIKLGCDFELNYTDCKLTLENKNILANPSEYDKLFKEIYIHKKYTKEKNKY